MGPDRLVSSVTKDDFVFWIAAETERGNTNNNPLKKGFASKVGLLGDFWGKLDVCPKNEFD
jgi:hypothetical protein